MRAIINGLRYDTESAIKIGVTLHRKKPFPTSDGWRATLYRTPRSGRFFLAGEGGTMTRWAGEERILPLNRNEALKWAEEYLTTDEVEAHFAEEVEDA